MSSCNFLPPQRAGDTKSFDTVSEVSESGTATSGWNSAWDSREDLRDFATKLGLQDVADLYQDRFRIDRKKLEQMLSGDQDAPLPADIFFEQIMADTGTVIRWPSKLKIGAKSKKDPHVRIAGRPEDVQTAKERILTILDARFNRVTMKMDVSYTDHSHIIGKGGLSIKRVMEETHCHVHFPDSNRSNPIEKSNQVSISGDIEGVENARSRVRELIPLIFGFELPIMSQTIDINSAYVEKIKEQYRVQVMVKTRPKLHATYILVKGLEWEVEQVKMATMLLMEYMCESFAKDIMVQMTMEISPHHHSIVMGKNHSNLKAIMNHTQCQIMFPDALDPNIPSLKKSSVTITGRIDNVYKARQLLMGSLPLLIIFDLPEESSMLRTKTEQLTEFSNKYDLTINIRQKAKLNVKACVIKGIERNAANIYMVRNLILGIDEPFLNANIPPLYFMPESNGSPIKLSSNQAPSITFNPPPISPISPLISPTWQFAPLSPYVQPPFVGMLKQQRFAYNVVPGSNGPVLLGPGYRGQHFSGSTEPSPEGSCYSPSVSSATSLSPSRSPQKSPVPNFQKLPSDSENIETLTNALSEMNTCGGYHGPTVDKRQERNAFSSSDYEQKRLAGLRAMQNPATGYRVPTGSWSGYGISVTSPAGLSINSKIPQHPKSDENAPISTLGIKTPKNMFNMFYSGYMWLKDRAEDDGAEGLWRIHDDLYDFTEFIERHPGGPEWLQLTKGMDITEAFEVHHLSQKPELLLKRFHVSAASVPRNAPFTFRDDGFYRTLKRRVVEILPTLNRKPARWSDVMTDAVFLGTYLFGVLAARYWNFALVLLSGFCLGCTTIASHNYLHRRDNFRMYYFNLCGWHYREFRISHVLSHHLHTNTIDDMEVSGFEPFFQYLPREKKPLIVRYGSWFYSPILWMLNFPLMIIRRTATYLIGKTETMHWSDFIPFTLPLVMYLFGKQPFGATIVMWLCIVVVASTHFFFVGLNAAHHHPDLFHDGDTPRPSNEMDWGIAELDAVVDRYDISGSHWLVLTNFGDHALHHLFPTLDHGVLEQLYPVFKEMMEQFGLNLRFASQLTCIKGNFKQLCNQGRNKNPPNLFKKIE